MEKKYTLEEVILMFEKKYLIRISSIPFTKLK